MRIAHATGAKRAERPLSSVRRNWRRPTDNLGLHGIMELPVEIAAANADKGVRGYLLCR